MIAAWGTTRNAEEGKISVKIIGIGQEFWKIARDGMRGPVSSALH